MPPTAIYYHIGAVALALLCSQPLAAQTTGGFRGSIKNHLDQALHGATVSLEPDRHAAQTDADGSFSFSALYPGVYYIHLQHIGYDELRDSVIIEAGKTVKRTFELHRSSKSLEEVQVNASAPTTAPAVDNLIELKRSAMPMQVITRRTIELMGSRRLDEVLKEQTGMAIVNNIGGGSRSVGVQMQGFGSEYVMILIDGQPMVGRNNGNFDLSRISVSNIERIEIVKGASSCLFGSEALGGAINIITRHGAVEPQAVASLNYGSLNIVDATLDTEMPFANQRGTANFSANYYRTDGFSTNSYLQDGPTGPPYDNYATQARLRYRLAKNSTIGTSVRYGLRKSFMSKNWGDDWISNDSQDEKDLNLSLTFDHQFHSGWRTMMRYYFTQYKTNEFMRWADQSASVSANAFTQRIHRLEQQFARQYRNGLQLTAGLGLSKETMMDNALQGSKDLHTFFGYIQGEKQILSDVTLLGGIRYDHADAYGGKVNPSLGLQYQLSEKLLFKMGVGTGFKAPDFRMRYQVFFNPMANYLVVGNEVLAKTLADMWASGLISETRTHLVNQLSNQLAPERSVSYNAGFTFRPKSNISLEASLYYHRIQDQINPVMVATGTAIQQIYSYQNLPKAVNKGIEFSGNWSPLPALELQLGYQYLIAKDLSVVDSIRTGNWPYNQNLHDPKTGESFAPKTSDYWGIENRSRHMLNARLFYTYRPWDASISLRLNYRGKYPFTDYNLNNFIDRYDIFVPSHTLVNAYVEKKLYQQRLTLRFTVDNLLDFTNLYMLGQPGRLFIAGLTYRWHK